MRNDFILLVLSYNRPTNVLSLETLKKTNYDGNWDKKNSNVIILERTGGRKLDPNSKTIYCIGNEQICYEYTPCVYAANESRASWQADMNYLISLQ